MTAVTNAFPRVVLFDLDGTLLDSAPDMLATVDAMRAARGRGPMAMDLLRPVVSKGARAMTAAAFPDHAILGEESGANAGTNANSPYRWIVDPLDGTMNFVHGYPYYAVSIAMAHGPDVTHAVVLDPVHDELFTAIKGRGAQLNAAPIHTSACTRLQDALIGTVIPVRKSPRLARFLPILGALATRCTLRRAGAGALDLAYVAAGRLDGFFEMSLGTWDVAAGTLLVAEAGGRVGDFAGGPDFMRGNEVIAAAPGIFTPLREAIAGVLTR